MQAVALGILVTAKTHNPLWTGLVAAAAFLPNGLLAPFGGALADRLDRRRWLLATTWRRWRWRPCSRCWRQSGTRRRWWRWRWRSSAASAAAIGLPAYQAMLPDLVDDPADLLAAVSLSSAQYNLGRVIGPALAGIVLALGSYALAFACNAASFAAVVVALVFVRLPPITKAAEPLRIVRRIAEGVRLAAAEPACRSAHRPDRHRRAAWRRRSSRSSRRWPSRGCTGSGHRGSVGTSVLVTAQGIGAVTGALLLPGLALRFGRAKQVVVALFVLPVLLVAYGLRRASGSGRWRSCSSVWRTSRCCPG